MSEIVTLIPVEEKIVRGNISREAKREEAREVFARVSSIGEREFYDAMQAGVELSLRADIWLDEYESEGLLQHAGQEYRIVRTYRNARTRRAELYCEKVKGREG